MPPFSSLSCTTTGRGSSTASPSAGGSRARPCSSSLHTGLSAFCLPLYLFTLNCCLFTFTHAARTIRRGSRPHSRPRSSPRTSTGRPTPRFPRQRLSTFTQRIKRWDYFIILVILDVLSYTVPHSINMTWRSIIDIFFCRAANRRSWCSTRWRSASPK